MSELLNVVGLTLGVALYSMLLVMVLGADRSRRPSHVDPLLLATSVLGLAWNVCALPVYELPRLGVEGVLAPLNAVGLSALGFLPAVVVHSVLRGEHDRISGRPTRLLASIAYAASAVAAALHMIQALRHGDVPSAFGMRLLTYAFVALALPVAVVTRNQPGSRRTLWAAALAIFAVSALHLSQLHKGESSWPVELLGHHASLPLAVAILYQDYPFAFADLFLRRAIALLGVVTVTFAGIAVFRAELAAFPSAAPGDVRQIGVLASLWIGTALLFPAIRRGSAWLVNRVILRRPDYRRLRGDLIRRIQAQDDTPTLLSEVCRALGPALNAMDVTWREAGPQHHEETDSVVVSGTRTLVMVPTTDEPRFVVEVAGLTGGRRLLSDDVATLEAIANAMARQVDAVRLRKERFERQLREQEIGKLATEAELRALRAQVNPHFLFNALTTIGFLIQTAPSRALETLMRLTALLRAVLRSEGEVTSLGREIDLIEAYLDIERARFEQRLRVTIEVPARLRHIHIPSLLIQPLVENAVKHGIAPLAAGGEVLIHADTHAAGTGRHLVIVVRDSGVGADTDALERGRERGVGLRNIERRLRAQYGSAASLSIQSAPSVGTTAEVRIPILHAVAAAPPADRVAV